MGGTNKAIFYKKCCELGTDDKIKMYKSIYQKTTLEYWVEEYKNYLKERIYKSELIKIYLGNKLKYSIKAVLDLRDTILKYFKTPSDFNETSIKAQINLTAHHFSKEMFNKKSSLIYNFINNIKILFFNKRDFF